MANEAQKDLIIERYLYASDGIDIETETGLFSASKEKTSISVCLAAAFVSIIGAVLMMSPAIFLCEKIIGDAFAYFACSSIIIVLTVAMAYGVYPTVKTLLSTYDKYPTNFIFDDKKKDTATEETKETSNETSNTEANSDTKSNTNDATAKKQTNKSDRNMIYVSDIDFKDDDEKKIFEKAIEWNHTQSNRQRANEFALLASIIIVFLAAVVSSTVLLQSDIFNGGYSAAALLLNTTDVSIDVATYAISIGLMDGYNASVAFWCVFWMAIVIPTFVVLCKYGIKTLLMAMYEENKKED